jgi:hypothetical protein
LDECRRTPGRGRASLRPAPEGTAAWTGPLPQERALNHCAPDAADELLASRRPWRMSSTEDGCPARIISRRVSRPAAAPRACARGARGRARHDAARTLRGVSSHARRRRGAVRRGAAQLDQPHHPRRRGETTRGSHTFVPGDEVLVMTHKDDHSPLRRLFEEASRPLRTRPEPATASAGVHGGDQSAS